MSARYTVTFYHHMTVYNVMYHQIGGVIQAFTEQKTKWKEDLSVAVKLGGPNLSKYYTDLTSMPGMLHISVHSFNSFQKLWLFWMWHRGIVINTEAETSYSTQYQQAFVKYLENKECVKRRCVPVNKPEHIPCSNLVLSITASWSCQS